MIGLIEGKVIFANEKEVILLTNSGVGYQIYARAKFIVGEATTLFISTIFRESGTELFGFSSIYEKKFFELLLSVKGVGPKSAYALMSNLEIDLICTAIETDQKNVLKEAPGVGNKVAAQIILDLKDKIRSFLTEFSNAEVITTRGGQDHIVSEAILACRELGLPESKVLLLANKLMREHNPRETSDLVQFILRELRS